MIFIHPTCQSIICIPEAKSSAKPCKKSSFYLFLRHPRVKVSIVGSLRDREVACSASDRQGSNFESCVWRTVSSQSSHHLQEVLLAQFSLYVHKGGLKPDSFQFPEAKSSAKPCKKSSFYLVVLRILHRKWAVG